MADDVKKPEQAPAEGDRATIDRELARQDEKNPHDRQQSDKQKR
ncbi:hypothetical protein ACFSE1_05680 [Rhizobium helianthi]|uniref:Uncharacterized protein n=1 Tax=Rhizobium helianthi TaxID=1132695 RepID=A0ABW4M118_9HYPH